MRVLHLHSGNMYGGVETLLATVVREAAAAPGMTSDVALCFSGRLGDELAAMGRPAFMLAPVRLSRPHTVLRARSALRRLLDAEAFDAVVCHQPWTCVVFGPVVRAAGFPVVLWVHMAVEGRGLLDRLARRVRPDLAICNSHFTRMRVGSWLTGVKSDVVHPPVGMPRAVGADSRPRMRRELDTSDRDVVITMVSRMEPWKGHRALIGALARLAQTPGWTCWIVGGPQSAAERAYERGLRELVRAHGLDERVRFTGHRRDVSEILGAADVFCQPNVEPEPYGMSFVEALHAGLPVVTSAIGGALEIVTSDCGVLVRPGDEVALSGVLSALITDPAARDRLARGARARLTELDDLASSMRRLQQVLLSAGQLPRAAVEAFAG